MGAEEIGRDAADETGRRAKPADTDRDVETGAADDGHEGIAPIRGLDRQEVDERITAAHQHGTVSSLATGRNPATRRGR